LIAGCPPPKLFPFVTCFGLKRREKEEKRGKKIKHCNSRHVGDLQILHCNMMRKKHRNNTLQQHTDPQGVSGGGVVQGVSSSHQNMQKSRRPQGGGGFPAINIGFDILMNY